MCQKVGFWTNSMSTLQNKKALVEHTAQFFSLHWGFETPHPEWELNWDWTGPAPNYLLGGLYALFAKEELIYIGLGASRGGGPYKERGISRRLSAHVLKIAPEDVLETYLPQERWLAYGVDLVGTLGFEQENSYLAPSLEDYLIGHLNPPENYIKKVK